MKKRIDPIIVWGVVISILVSIIMVLIGQDMALSFIVGLLVTIIALILDLQHNAKSNEKLLQEMLVLYEDPWLYETIKEISTGYEKVKFNMNAPFFLDKSRNVLQTCAKEITNLAKGNLTVAELDQIANLTDLLHRTKAQARAVSYVTFDWWYTEAGQKYIQEHADLVKNGMRITRIFITPENRLEDLKNIVIQQCKIGIDVWIAFEEKVEPDLLETYIIIDDNIVSKSRIILGGRLRGSNVTANRQEVMEAIHSFNLLLNSSRRAEKLFQLDKS
jgi:flagellar biosynthesis protein FliQ